MIRLEVRTVVRQGDLARFVSGEVAQSVLRASGKVRDRAKLNVTRAGRIDTGGMRNQIVSELVEVTPRRVVARVESRAPYSLFQHEGTANNGAGTIVPRRTRVLRFKPRGSAGFVYAREVRGVKGVPFLTDALDSLYPADFT